MPFDISKDSVQIAAKSEPDWAVNWFVGDLARLPIKDASMDILLDIFSPANYGEFRQFLSKERDILMKLFQLKSPQGNPSEGTRPADKQGLFQPRYQNHFQEHFTILSSKTASLTKTITADQAPIPTQHDAPTLSRRPDQD